MGCSFNTVPVVNCTIHRQCRPRSWSDIKFIMAVISISLCLGMKSCFVYLNRVLSFLVPLDSDGPDRNLKLINFCPLEHN
jgi:hypothetical protein